MTILTAQVSDVQLGNFTFEGLMFSDGSFGISVPQIQELISFSASKNANNTISRDLKRLLGNDFSPSKVKIEGLKQLINSLTLVDFELLLINLDRKHSNRSAQKFRDELVGLSLHQLFSDAFDIKFEKAERQAWLTNRQATKNLFFDISEQTKIWYEATKEERSQPFETYCINVSNAINKGLFGKNSKAIKIELGINDLIRDYFNSEALRRIAQIESIAINKLKLESNLRPVDAVKFALEVSNFEILVEYKGV